MVDNPVILFILSVVWIPSVVGLVYLWQIYLSVRALGNQWLLQTWCFTSVPITITLLYVSYATYERLAGRPLSTETTQVAGVLLALGLAGVVPFKAIRVWLATHGRSTQPEIPVNGKGSNGN